MEIRRITEPADVAKILRVVDNVNEIFPCSKGEWVQWLMKAIENPRILLIGNFDGNGNINGYLIAINTVIPPIDNSITILYHFTNEASEGKVQELNVLKDWAIECGATAIKVNTRDSIEYQYCGFKKMGNVEMIMVL